VTLAPWDYLFKSFSHDNFPDIFHPTWIAAVVLLVILTVLYNVRTRALHRHAPYLDMWEWLWWTGLITFSLIVIEALFVFDFFLVLTTLIIGLGTLVWVRFVRFPPFLAAYETRLAKERYFTRQKYADPEATIKKRGAGRRQGRQQRRRR
jgi:ABC-type xylose transport system permease subunit